ISATPKADIRQRDWHVRYGPIADIRRMPAYHQFVQNNSCWLNQTPDQRADKMNTPLLLVGLIVCAAGILFAGQGLGYINWPASSFMISQMKWVYYGGGIAVVGILLVIIALR
ncbi:MAG: hypothetical protein WBV51_17245, partial [Pseudolabrys sp.]